MGLYAIFLVALSLAMDAFAVSITNGISVEDFGKKDSIKQGIYFGFFQSAMPVLGWFLGTSVKVYIEAVDHWIAFVLLAGIGGSMIWESLKKDEGDSETKTKLTAKNLVVQGIATSIDALAIGISFAILDVNIFVAALMIGVVAFILSYLGGILGKSLGGFLQKKTEFAGGAILVLIGVKILLEHTIFL